MEEIITNSEACVLVSPFNLKVKNIQLGQLGNNEVLIKIHYVSICGSDIKLYHGQYNGPHKYPLILGHEWVGEIIKIGNHINKKNFNIGDFVTGDCSIYCDNCDYCKIDKNQCRQIEKTGITLDGACSQYIIRNEKYLYKCPNLEENREIFALAEPLAVVINALKKVPNHNINFKNALVFGAGGIGILTIFVLQNSGVKNITLVDKEPEKLKLALSFGENNLKTICSNIQNYLESEMLYDLIIEASGCEQGISNALKLIRPNGVIICIGHQKLVTLDFEQIIKKSLKIIGSIGGTGSFPDALKLLEKHYKEIPKIITKIIKYDEVGAFLKNYSAYSNGIKYLIKFI